MKSLEQTVELQTSMKKNAGRPKCSTNIRKHHLKEVALEAKKEIAKLYFEEKEKYKRQGKRLVNKWFDEKIVEVSTKRCIATDVTISPYTIRNRKPGQLVLQGGGPESLMASVEQHTL